MVPLIFSWAGVTVVMAILIIMRRVMESHEADWIPITTAHTGDIQQQVQLEKKVHKLTPVIRIVEVLDVLLLLAIVGIWIYNGIYTPPKPPI